MKNNKIKEEVLKEINGSIGDAHVDISLDEDVVMAIDLTLKKQQEEFLKLIDDEIDVCKIMLKKGKLSDKIYANHIISILEDLKKELEK